MVTEGRLPWVSCLVDDDGEYDYQEHDYTWAEAFAASGENPRRLYTLDDERMERPAPDEGGNDG